MAEEILGNIAGPQGTPGADGKSATIEIGTVSTGEAGTEVEVENVGDETNAILDITIPKGEKGDAGDKGDTGEAGADGEGSEAVNLPTMRITATAEDLAVMTKANAIQVSYVYTDRDRTKEGFATLQWQGSSSVSYPKKNFNFKTYTNDTYSKKEKVQWKPTWPVTNRINLKANWIDATYARNVGNGKLVASVIASNLQIPDELYSSPNLGQVDGYPILVYINDECLGVYTLNLGKKEDMLGCSDEEKHIIFEGARSSTTTRFSVNNNDTGDWEREYPDDDDITTEKADEITASLNEFMTFVSSSDDATFAAEVEQRTNVPMLIDYMIMVQLFNASDNLGKNQMLVSYDGGASWVLQLRDLDTTWSLHWAGTELYSNTRSLQGWYGHNLMTRVYNLYSDYFKSRYTELRKNVLSDGSICKRFHDFMVSVGEGNYQLDQSIWPDIPSISLTNYQQLQQAIVERTRYLDSQYNISRGFVFDADIVIDEIADYSVVELTELRFRDTITKDNVLYAVQPESDSGVVYFLGKKAVDLVYESGALIYARNYYRNSYYRFDLVPTYSLYNATETNNLAAALAETDGVKALHITRDASDVGCGLYISKTVAGYAADDDFGISFDIKGTSVSWRNFTLASATVTRPSNTTISPDSWKTLTFVGQNTAATGSFTFYTTNEGTEDYYLKHLRFAKADVTGLAYTEPPEDVVG